jgi:hypothetical protein
MAKKKRPTLEMRSPDEPSESEKEAWVKGDDTPKDSDSTPPSSTASSTAAPKEASEDSADSPSGPGIIEYADGSYRRRTTVYLSLEAAKKLRLIAALENAKLNDLIVDAIDSYLETKETPSL